MVLVIGAGGSLGSELCRQIARHNPARIFMLDHDDTGLDLSWQSLGSRSPAGWDDLMLADIRDLAALSGLLSMALPDVVFHTAALKDRELLERHPREAWRTNVVGTRNVLQAATAAGVGTFVNVSWPGADGDTVLGRTQRAAERLTTAWARAHLGRYVSVRVADATVSGIPLEERCRLVLAATARATDGHVVEALPRPLSTAEGSAEQLSRQAAP